MRDKRRPSLADIAGSQDRTLKDLAAAAGIGRQSLAQLGGQPPSKYKTWQKKWKNCAIAWMPILGPAFTEIFRSQEFAHCPPAILDEIRTKYLDELADIVSQLMVEKQSMDITGRNQQQHQYVQEANFWREAGKWYRADERLAEAVRLYYPYEFEWTQYRLEMAQLRVLSGSLDAAEAFLDETVLFHEGGLHIVGKEWDPSISSLAHSTYAWSHFLRGERWEAVERFAQATHLARESDNNTLLHRGIHMGARALMEQEVLLAYFPDISALQSKWLSGQVARSLADIDDALKLDEDGSTREAFGLWYKGILVGLNGDLVGSKKLLKRAEAQIQEHGDKFRLAVVSHTELSLIHFDILTSHPDPLNYHRFASKLSGMYRELADDEFPRALAEALITMVYCRFKDDILRYDLRETTDYICLALLIHPHPKHALWQIGKRILVDVVLPEFSDNKINAYIHSLEKRVTLGDAPFDYLTRWQLDTSHLDVVLKLIKQVSESS